MPAALITRKARESSATPDIARRMEIACKRLSVYALNLLEKVVMDDTQETRWRLQAAKEILDRGFGRPKQSVDQKITVSGGEAFLNIIEEARARVADSEELKH